MGEAGKRKVIPLHHHFFVGEHVRHLAPCDFRLHRVVIVERVPACIAYKQKRRVRDIAVHKHLTVAQADQVLGAAG